MDHVGHDKRSEIMRAVRTKNSGPEMVVRRLIHALGYRYTLHAKKLPGSPDLVFPARRKVVFVHGCFWHGHARCSKARLPRSRTTYWGAKVETNKRRDRRNLDDLAALGWNVLVLWQCQLKDAEQLTATITEFLDNERTH